MLKTLMVLQSCAVREVLLLKLSELLLSGRSFAVDFIKTKQSKEACKAKETI
jgi:hypothetical protein